MFNPSVWKQVLRALNNFAASIVVFVSLNNVNKTNSSAHFYVIGKYISLYPCSLVRDCCAFYFYLRSFQYCWYQAIRSEPVFRNVFLRYGRRQMCLIRNATVPSMAIGLFYGGLPHQGHRSRELHLYCPRNGQWCDGWAWLLKKQQQQNIKKKHIPNVSKFSTWISIMPARSASLPLSACVLLSLSFLAQRLPCRLGEMW